MLIDKRALFLDAVSLAQAAGTYTSDVIDLWNGSASAPAGPLGTPVFDIGRGEEVELLCRIIADFTSGGAATLQIQLIMADSADLATNPVTLWDSGAIAKATLVAGYNFRMRCLPFGISKRYLGIKYTIGTAAGTGGAITAALVDTVSDAPGEFV